LNLVGQLLTTQFLQVDVNHPKKLVSFVVDDCPVTINPITKVRLWG